MDGDVLGRRAFSLIELSLVLAIVAVFFAITLHSAKEIRQIALAERVIKELDSIAIASTRYYGEHGAWPASLSDLRPGYLGSGSSDLNPFGNAYVITGGNQAVSVSCVLPKGLITTKSMGGSEVVVTNQGDNDLVSVTKSLETRIWKLKYEKKYIHHQ